MLLQIHLDNRFNSKEHVKLINWVLSFDTWIKVANVSFLFLFKIKKFGQQIEILKY